MRETERTRNLLVDFLVLALLLLMLPTAAFAGKGPGGGGGGKGDLYSDLLVVLRDVAGVPILGPETGDGCLQPITTATDVPNPLYLLDGTDPPTLGATTNPVDGSPVTLVPLFASLPDAPEGEIGTAEEDEVEPCDILVLHADDGTVLQDYTVYASEVDLERLNFSRTTLNVIGRKLDEVVKKLDAASTITLDPAGRLTADGVAIDAAPEQMAIRQSLLETGTIPRQPIPFEVTQGLAEFEPWSLSAAAMGAAAGKGVVITVDSVVYLDRALGIAYDWIASGAWPLSTLTATWGERFVDYSGFEYDRAEVFPGCATYLALVDGSYQMVTHDYLEVVPFGALPAVADADGVVPGVAGYAQLADDARAVILFLHERLVESADGVGLDSCDDGS